MKKERLDRTKFLEQELVIKLIIWRNHRIKEVFKELKLYVESCMKLKTNLFLKFLEFLTHSLAINY